MLKALAKDSAIYAAADLLVKSTQIILTPYYLSRLTVEEFGHFGVIVAIMALGSTFFNLGFQSGLIRFYHLEVNRRPELLTSSLLFLTLFAIPTVPGLAWLVDLSAVFEGAALPPRFLVLLVAASALFGIFINNGMALFKVRQEPLKSGMLGFLSSFTALVTIVVLVEGERFSNLEGIVVGQFVGMGVGTAISLAALRPLLTRPPAFAMFRKVFGYSNPLVAHNFMQWVLNSADRLILVRILGAEALGGYFFAYQFGTGLKLIGRSLNNSILHIYSELAADTSSAPKALFASKTFLWAVGGLFLAVGFVAPIAIWLTPWDKFDAYLYLVPMLSAGAALYLVYYLPMNVLSLTLGRSHGIYVLSLVAALVSVGLNLLLVPYGVGYAAVVNVIAFGILTAGFLLTVVRSPDGRRYLPVSAAVGVMAGVAGVGLLGGALLSRWPW